MKRLLLLLLVCLPVFAETLQFTDRARIVGVSDPQIAPDGRQIAAVVSRANLKDNRFDTEVVLVDVAMDAGAGPGRDVMAGIEAVKKRYSVDTTRMGVGGWSYGGYMTSWMIGNYPTTFKAAVSGAAVNNFLDQYTLGDYNVQWGASWGSPFKGDNMKRYLEQSPITYAHKVRTPTLILSNTGDARVPVTESFAMFRALRDNDVPARFIAYPLSGHSPEDPVHQMDVDRRWVEWFATYLK